MMCYEAYSIMPKDTPEVQRFLLSPIPLSFQTWLDYAFKILAACIFISTMWYGLPVARKELKVFFWCGIGYLADYFIIYNDPFAKIHVGSWTIPISYTLFMVLILIIVVGFSFYKLWR